MSLSHLISHFFQYTEYFIVQTLYDNKKIEQRGKMRVLMHSKRNWGPTMQFLPDPSCPMICNIILLPINIMMIFCRSLCKRAVKGSLSRFLGFPAKFCSIWGFVQCACWNTHHMRTSALAKLSNTYLALRLWRNTWKIWCKCTSQIY